MSNLKKKFIDKRNSVTFQVVHRSLKDPLSADETAPQRVLVPVPDKKSTKQQINDNCDLKNQKEEQKKYGVFFDDDYNYLQHLRDVTRLHSEWVEEKSTAKLRSSIDGHNYKISLPSSAFESGIEEKVGLFNKVSPELNIQLESYDPDVIAALDDDFAFDDPNNELEDNFVELAEKKSLQDIILSNREFNEESYLHSNTTNNFNAFKNIKYAEDSQSCFTAYSMSSSIIKRNDKLNLLDDTFETVYADYSEEDIGALNCDHIEGHLCVNSDLLLGCTEEYRKLKNGDVDNITSLIKNQVKITNNEFSASITNSRYEHFEKVVANSYDTNWDCESVLSTYSTCNNRPKLIVDALSKDSSIKISPKTGLPKITRNKPANEKLTFKNLSRCETECIKLKIDDSCVATNSMKSLISTISHRPENETLDEKKKRKKMIKIYRKERRKERKENTITFKQEKKQQEKILINQKQNIQGNHIF